MAIGIDTDARGARDLNWRRFITTLSNDVGREAGIQSRHETEIWRSATVPPIGEAEPIALPLIPEGWLLLIR